MMGESPHHKTGEDNSRRSRTADPDRFTVTRATLRLDAFMNRFIFVGGLAVIFVIFGIFVFILLEILPLFRGATVKEEKEPVSTPVREVRLLGVDEWIEYPFVMDSGGNLTFVDPSGSRPPKTLEVRLPEGVEITSSVYSQKDQTIGLGLSDGRFILATVRYSPRFPEGGGRLIEADVKWEEPHDLGEGDSPVTDINVFIGESRKSIAAITGEGAQARVEVVSLVQKRTLFGSSGFTPDYRETISPEWEGYPLQVLIGAKAESLVVRTDRHEVCYFYRVRSEWQLRQRFEPFPDDPSGITSMAFMQGNVSLSFTSADGRHLVYSLYRSGPAGERRFGVTREFEPFPGGATEVAVSTRNKAFLLGNEDQLSLRYSTTTEVRWQSDLSFPLANLLIGSKFDQILGTDPEGKIHLYALHDPHPEAGFRAFFSKIWYEGQDSPQYAWQSTGGTDDFEPKLSLIPLIIGSLKGTFYALVFAIPIALLAAIYTSQFLSPDLKRVIKPGIEIMASLPSVVLGFLGALWLAPLIEDRVPSILLITIAIPFSAVVIGSVWNTFPIRIRNLVPKGWEFIIFIPVILIVSTIAWHLGPHFESIAFRYTDPATSQSVGNFQLWWEARTGDQFQQRNSLVVGFMMGFAVIPIIYTISEDALSAVPSSLVSGSLALGASRWQTTARIILPTASAGIFSAVMIGLGRAVGETMIVLMATGNTPIMDFDIFSGMRTLSANIAVELPEAPHGGTLYRTLFLGAFVLFVMTFFVNTIAEVLRTRLRNRFKVVN